ncbi:MAG: cytochrome c [Acidimicrobiia bacterium]
MLLVSLVACSNNAQTPPDPTRVIELGRDLFHSEGCVHCHGENGQGLIGPRLNNGSVLDTFSSCADQARWIEEGSAGWLRDFGSSYGDTNKPVKGGMPGFGKRLDPEQLRAVASFTRVVFGGADPDRVIADCYR